MNNLQIKSESSFVYNDGGRPGPATEIDGKIVSMADLIMKPGPDEYVIHVNGNVLDCRRANMRIVKRGVN
jgi:hypothetical protein